jgi:hypothetical protein
MKQVMERIARREQNNNSRTALQCGYCYEAKRLAQIILA